MVMVMVIVVAQRSSAAAITYTWTGGGGANTNWSTASNWGGSGPSNNESDVGLVFPALAAPYASNNNLTGLQVTSLAITTQVASGTYTFTGNAITLRGPVTMASPASGTPNLAWQMPVVLDGDATLSSSGRQTRLQGPIDLGSSTLTLDAAGDILLDGVVSGSGNLIKDNTSALTITGTNTYTGSTTGNRGAFYIGSAAALGGAGAGTTFNGGFLGFVPGSTFVTAEPFVFNGGGILAYGTPGMTGQVTLNTTIDIQAFNPAAILTMSGVIVGSGGFSKTGPGLLILNALGELYEGAAVVDSGTLELDADLSSTNPLTVKSGATLTGSASSAGPISVQSGGTVAPGASGAGQLASSGLTMAAGATLAASIDGPNAATQYDILQVSGAVALGGATLSIVLGYAPPDGQQFTLIAQLQAQPASGTFSGLPEGAGFQVGDTMFGITYKGGAGNDVVLVAGGLPTPASTATLTAAATNTAPPTNTATAQTGTATATSTATQTPSPAGTGTSSATPSGAPGTPTFTPTPTPPGGAAPCTGDCDGLGAVTVNELVTGVNIALKNELEDVCPRFDADGNDVVTNPELIEAVGIALNGCPPPPQGELGRVLREPRAT
jgi:fibronectin-binding autotransporter adhesin